MFGLGFWEIGVILVIALIFLGPKKLPELAKSLGKGIREFRSATEDFKSTIDQELTKPEPKRELPQPKPPVGETASADEVAKTEAPADEVAKTEAPAPAATEMPATPPASASADAPAAADAEPAEPKAAEPKPAPAEALAAAEATPPKPKPAPDTETA